MKSSCLFGRGHLVTAAVFALAALVAEADAGLPDGYTRLTYIESTFKQCIHTGYIPTWGDKIECDVKVAYIGDTSSSFALFGKRDGELTSNDNNWYFRFQRDGTQSVRYGTTESYVRGGEYFREACDFLRGYDGGYLVHFTMQTNLVEWSRHDGTFYGYCVASASATPPTMNKEICIFGINHADNKWVSYPTNLRLYSFRATSADGTVLCDFVPCYRNSDCAVGLYDVIRGLFRSNESTASGTGPFKAGPLYGEMPLGFRKARYVQSTSAHQYIDTGYLHGTNDLYVMDYYAPKTWQVDGYCHLFGSWAGNNKFASAENLWFYIGGKGADYISYNHYTSNSGESGSVGYNYNLDPLHLEAQARTATWSCGSFSNSLTTTATFANWIEGKYPLFVFASNAGGNVSNPTIMRLYSFKIYRDIGGKNVLVHDFIPCVSGAGMAGLYDKVGDRFHGNKRSGSADFEYELEEASLPEGYERAKWIQSTTAHQYIDTGYWHGTNDLVVMDYYAQKTWQDHGYCYLFGSKATANDSAENWYFYIGGSDNQNVVCYNHKTPLYEESPATYSYTSDPVHLECQARTATWTYGSQTGSLTTTATSASWSEGKYPLYIFTGNVAGGPGMHFLTVLRLYSFKIYRDIGGNMALVRDFVPCVEKATGRAGLYDLVGERFHGNARSGVADFKVRTYRGLVISFK